MCESVCVCVCVLVRVRPCVRVCVCVARKQIPSAVLSDDYLLRSIVLSRVSQ